MKHKELVAELLSKAWTNGCITQFPNNVTIEYNDEKSMWSIRYNGVFTIFDDWQSAAEWLGEILEGKHDKHPQEVIKSAILLHEGYLKDDRLVTTSKNNIAIKKLVDYILHES